MNFSPIGDDTRPNNYSVQVQYITFRRRGAYEGTCIIVGGTERFDALNVVSEEMKLDRFEAERSWLSARWFQRILRCGGLASTPLRVLGGCFNRVEFRAGHADKVPQAGTQCSCSGIEKVEGCVSVDAHLG